MEEFFGFLINFISESPNLLFPNTDLIKKILNFHKTASFEIRKTLVIFLVNSTNSQNFKLTDTLLLQIFEIYLQILANEIKDPDEKWLQDVSFDKMCKIL